MHSTNVAPTIRAYINVQKALRFKELTWGKSFLMCVVIATTDTSLIPGITAAGARPELTHYTPAADVEYVVAGRCFAIPTIPITPEGIPTPAIITRASLSLSGMGFIPICSGAKVKPKVPYVELGGEHGRDITSGEAIDVAVVKALFERGMMLGEELSKACEFLVVGESVPGGTTTALAVMLALGVDARGRVSSAMPNNPHELKIEVALRGLRGGGRGIGGFIGDPHGAVAAVGDPMIPAFAGVVSGASERVPVLLAGGTQMCAVLAYLRELSAEVFEGDIAVGTTRWLVSDSTADMLGLLGEVCGNRVPLLAADLDFRRCRFRGLRAYEEGYVKEGVGAGGSALACTLSTMARATSVDIAKKCEEEYGVLISRCH